MGSKSTKEWNQAYFNDHRSLRSELAQATSAPRFNRRPFMKTLTLLPWTAGAISSRESLLDWLKIEHRNDSSTSSGDGSGESPLNLSPSFTLAKQVPMLPLPEPQKWTVCAMLLDCLFSVPHAASGGESADTYKSDGKQSRRERVS